MATSIPDIDLATEQTMSVIDGGRTITVSPDVEYHVQVQISAWSVEHGPSMQITGEAKSLEPVTNEAAGKRGDRLGGHQYHVGWIAGTHRPLRIDGVYEPALAYAALADTIRAEVVHTRLLADRRHRAARLLDQARQAHDALTPAEQFTSGRAALLGAAWRVARWGNVPMSLIIEHTGLTDIEAERLDHDLIELDPEPVPLYMDTQDVADRIGVAVSSVRSYLYRDIMPEPQLAPGGSPAWEWDVIEDWIRTRRGQGWAAGTTADATGRR